MKVLVLNSGSSSQKSALFELEGGGAARPAAPLWEAKIEWQGNSASLEVSGNNAHLHEQTEVKQRRGAIARMLDTLWSGETQVVSSPSEIEVVGHRVVHGGDKLQLPTRITPQVKAVIASLEGFAPLHNRAELGGIETVERFIGNVPQVAVFDTGFHRTLPAEAAFYAGPYEWYEKGIKRYGFHGINYEYCAGRAAEMLGQASLRLVVCHLGNGCSLAAIKDGKSVDTTMGFTPLDGLMMGTRSGSVDPGILTYLLREKKATGEQLDGVLNKKSGLLGISGVSGDMRQVVSAMREGNRRSQLAFDMFVHHLRAGICAMAAALRGLDALVFTAGIGENSSEVRGAACSGLSFLGLGLDAEKNAKPSPDCEISSPQSKMPILIIRAQEDWAIAQSCWRVMHAR
jgi:acetate kinase